MLVKWNKFWKILISPFYDSSIKKLHKCEVVFIRHDNDCGYNYKNKKYSPIIDSAVEICISLGHSTLSIAAPFSINVGEFAFNSPYAFNRIFLLLAINRRILSLFLPNLRSNAWVNERKFRFWLKVLDKVRPKIIIGVQPDPQLCRASRKQNIQIYEIQHGVINTDHFWYCGILKDKTPTSELPHGFLCWDKASAQALNNWAPEKGIQVLVVGNPWFQRFFYPDVTDKLVQELIYSENFFENNRPTILVSLQWDMNFYYKNNSSRKIMIMCDALEQTIKSTSALYNWLIRLHPVQKNGEEGRACIRYLTQEFGKFDNIEWEINSEIPLPIVLTKCDLHITDMSSVVVEASWGGVPSALLNPLINEGEILADLFELERKIGIATVLPQNNVAIESWIERTLLSEKSYFMQKTPKDAINNFFQKVICNNE